MAEEPKPDDSQSKTSGLTRRKYLGVGAIALAGASGLGLAKQNKTNNSTSGNQSQHGSQSTSGKDTEGSQSESESENGDGSESESGNEKNEQEDRNEKNGENEKNDPKEVKPSQVSLSKQQAGNAATTQVSGTVQSVDLGNENGTPAYEVMVKTKSGSTKEVSVDANSGKVLQVGNKD